MKKSIIFLLFFCIVRISFSQNSSPYVIAEHIANINDLNHGNIKIYNNSLNKIRILNWGLDRNYKLVAFNPTIGMETNEKTFNIIKVNDTTLTIAPDSTIGSYRLYFTTQKLYDEEKYTDDKKSTTFLNFESVEPPSPTVKIVDVKTEFLYDSGGKVSITNLGKVYLRVDSDPAYKLICPKDCAYRVTSARITLIRNRKIIDSFSTSGEIADMTSLKVKCLPGDIIFIEINSLQRLSYTGQLIFTSLKDRYFSFNLIP